MCSHVVLTDGRMPLRNWCCLQPVHINLSLAKRERKKHVVATGPINDRLKANSCDWLPTRPEDVSCNVLYGAGFRDETSLRTYDFINFKQLLNLPLFVVVEFCF